MRVDVLTTFPHAFDSYLGESIMGRAQKRGLLEFVAHDLRDWTHDRHRTTDDYPYGGGVGLVMKCEPIFEAMDEIMGVSPGSLPLPAEQRPRCGRVVLMAPQGERFDDAMAQRLSEEERLVFVCGHYEGLDERVYALADEIVSLGDYVLTSGELASMVVIDAVVRKIPGVLGAATGAQEESFADGLLEHPQYTRPASFRGMDVPEVLLSGHHENIRRWQRRQSLERTAALRPDLIEAAFARDALCEEELEIIRSFADGVM